MQSLSIAPTTPSMCTLIALIDSKRVLVPTTVYIPEEGSPPPPSWTRHIRKMFPMVSFQGIPGDHRTCITQHSEVLGAQLKKALGALSQQVP